MKRLAVINCSKSKAKYQCKAEKMYWSSARFKEQVNFAKERYDDYIILSAKHGVLYPDIIIDPYDLTIGSGINILSGNEIEEWADNVINNKVWYNYDEIDFYITLSYWDPIKSFFKNRARWICLSEE